MPGEWGGTAAAYEASFGRLCAGAIDSVLDAVTSELSELRGSPDGHDTTAESTAALLDVGTGPGTLARAAVARGFRVQACDPEPSMIELARARSAESDGSRSVESDGSRSAESDDTRSTDPAQASGADLDYRVAGLPDLPYADHSFDVVCANFVVNHTQHPRDAVRELARVCGGVAAVTIWPRMRTTLNGLWSGVVRDAAASTPEGTQLDPERDFERTEGGLADLLDGAGFRSVLTSTLEWDFAIAADELWLAVEAGVATIGTTYVAQAADARARMQAAYSSRTAELVASDGLLHFPTVALLGVARSRGARTQA